MIDWILPITGVLIYFLTPKGECKKISEILAYLLICIFGYEQYVIENNISDSPVHEMMLFIIYSMFSYLFYKRGGRRQFKLSLVGMALSVVYGGFGAYYWTKGFYLDPRDFYWTEALVTLSILQLIIASEGVCLPTFYKKIGGHHGRNHSDSGRDTHHRRNG
jgi:hypothetical protein